MAEQTVAITVIVIGIIVLACKHSWFTITDDVSDKAYLLTKGVLTVYLLDLEMVSLK